MSKDIETKLLYEALSLISEGQNDKAEKLIGKVYSDIMKQERLIIESEEMSAADMGEDFAEDISIEEFPKPRLTNIRSEINYTGLVIDCRGLNLSEAITPAIKSVDGVEVYAYKNVGYQNAVEKGMVEYSANLDSERAGTSPLVIKAVKISGACDVVVSDEDADKILRANDLTKILVNCAVVLVR